MNKQAFGLIFYVILVTGANIYLWINTILMLAIAVLFSDKFSRNQYAPIFIKIGGLVGMTVLFFILSGR